MTIFDPITGELVTIPVPQDEGEGSADMRQGDERTPDADGAGTNAVSRPPQSLTDFASGRHL